MNRYEGMFLLDSAKAADWNQASAQVHGVLTRYGANVLDSRKWDELRLAYEVKGRKRGAYLLVYFEAPASGIALMRRDLELSDLVLRYLILAREGPIPPAGAARPAAEAPAAPPREGPPGGAPPGPPPQNP